MAKLARHGGRNEPRRRRTGDRGKNSAFITKDLSGKTKLRNAHVRTAVILIARRPRAPLQTAITAAERMPIVFERDGEVFADSRDVAAYFKKEHYIVLRDIRALVSKEPDLAKYNFVYREEIQRHST